MPVVALSEAREFKIGGVVGRPLAVPSRGSTEVAVWQLDVEPGTEGEAHTVSKEEVFVLQAGRMVGRVGGVEEEFGPGDAFIVQAGQSFSIANPGPDPARLIVCTSKGITATLNGQVIDPPWAQ